MDEQQYCRIIYGLKLKVKNLRTCLCPQLEYQHRGKFYSVLDDIQELIDDYEN